MVLYSKEFAAKMLDAGGAVTNVKNPTYGAKLDGVTDDRVAIQAAIDAASAAGGGTVLVPGGVIHLDSLNPDGAFFTPKDGVTVRGVGMDATIFKPADGLADWDLFRTDVATADIGFEDFTYDGNGTNNLLTSGAPNLLHGLFYIQHVNGLRVRRVKIKNVAGQRVMSIGTLAATKTATDVSIDDCHIETVADVVAGNVEAIDHSTFFIVADGVTLRGNHFKNATQSQVATAIECHSSNVVCTDNPIENYNIGIIIAAIASDKRNAIYANNPMSNVRSAYRVYCQNSHYLEADIDGGAISQEGDAFAVVDLDYCTTLAEYVGVKNLDIVNTDASPSGDNGYAIALGRVKTTVIDGVNARNLSGRFLSKGNQSGWEDNESSVYMTNCFDLDGGRTSSVTANAQDRVALFHTEKLAAFVAENNRFAQSSSTTKKAFTYNCDFGRLVIRENDTHNLEDGFAGTGAPDYADIQHVGNMDPETIVRAGLNSRWRNRVTGHQFIKKLATSNDSSGWRREVYGTAAPATGAWRVGEIVWNTAPAAAGNIGWVCTTAGTPGTWKQFGTVAS